MAFKSTWLIENYIIHHKLWGNFTREEVGEADEVLNKMLDASSVDKVHLLVNDEELEVMPSITALRSLTIAKHPKLGWSFIYGNKSKGLRFTTNIATKILGVRFMMAESYDHAMEKLYQLDPKLPPLDSEKG